MILTSPFTPEKVCDAVHLQIFRCNVQFNASIAKLVIPYGLWDSPVPTANPKLLNILERQAAAMLSMTPPPGKVEAAIRSLIGTKIHKGRPYTEKVARAMGFSPGNLQRKLQSMDKSLAGIVDDVRTPAARFYRRDSEVPVGGMWMTGRIPTVSPFSPQTITG